MTVIHAKTALLPEGWAQDVMVRIDAGHIAEVKTGVKAAVQLDCLLPALSNLHSHAFQRAMAGMTEFRSAGQDSFWTWRSLMYRFLDRLTPEDAEAIAALVMVEMAEAGYAAIGEFHYLHHGVGGQRYGNLAEMTARIAAAAAQTGLGLTHLPVLYERGGCDGRALAAGQLRFGNTPEQFAALWQAAQGVLRELPADTILGVAPHSLRAASGAGIALVTGFDSSTPVHIHVAEQMAEVVEVEAEMGARPVQWLLENQDLSSRWCLIHATQMQDWETEAMAKSGAIAGLCPITEANLGDGIFDGARFLAAGGQFGVGSDSNVRISLSEELRLLEYSQRLGLRARAVMAEGARSVGRVVYQGAATGGARAMGRASGAIEVGLWADLVALDCTDGDMVASQGDMLLDSFIFARDDRLVRELWSAGRHIVTQGRHFGAEAIRARYAKTVARLRGAI